MLSCAYNVIPQCRRCWSSLFEDSSFLASPSPLQGLPIFAKTMAFILIAQPSSSTHRKTRHFDQRVFSFIELDSK